MIKCEAISVEPTVLPPVVVGTVYTQSLVAKGANSNFTWWVNSSSLPHGLTWNANSHQLSGTVTDPAQVGNAFNLVLGLAASDVIMDPLTAPLNITVQSAPAAASSSMPPWEMRLILLGSGLAIGALGSIALSRLLEGRANSKTVEAIDTGWTNIENATNRNPKLTAQTKTEFDNEKTELMNAFIIPSLQKSRDHYALRQQTLRDRIAANEALLERLTKYGNDHTDDQPNDPVMDPELKAAGYDKFSDIQWGILRATGSNYRDQIISEKLAYDYNSTVAKIASNQDRTNEINIDKSNNNHLLHDK